MTSSLNGMPGPTSRIYFSQRLRLHYVDWGNPEAPPLLLVHGGRDHCRNWDWVAAGAARRLAHHRPDLRGHGDSQWSPDGNYSMSAYIYDLAQLIHQQDAGAGDDRRPFARRQHRLRYAGIYPEKVRKLVAIEGLGPSPKVIAERRETTMAERMRDWVDEQRKLSGRLPRRYAYDRGRLQAHAGGEHAPVGRAGAPPDAARRQPERGRHLQLEVRQLRARLAALRHELRATSRSCGRASPARRCWSTARRAGPPTRRRTAALEHFKNAEVVEFDQRRPLGAPRPAGRFPHHDGGVHQMKAAIFRAGDIVVGDIPEPRPAAGQVLVKTLACGICGSDLHAAQHAHRMVEMSKRVPGRIADGSLARRRVRPRVLLRGAGLRARHRAPPAARRARRARCRSCR